jgi:Pyruvate/2-oxoacid:ferredoxin oxidoreductase delta subunit
MGHLLGTESSLVPLIDRLNRYPIGLVDSPRLREILSLLLAEREAEVASRFPLHEATPAELACNVKCIGLAPDACIRPRNECFAGIDQQVCLGCDACISTCEHDAIHLVPRPNPAIPPRTKDQMFAPILWEKGRLWPFVADRASQGWRTLTRRHRVDG